MRVSCALQGLLNYPVKALILYPVADSQQTMNLTKRIATATATVMTCSSWRGLPAASAVHATASVF